ncbi:MULTISPECIES: gamma-glutamylcyclotransferase [unclassified Devosia]|uniref:gamma-glutamylcyclotransferase n=1 Tax=unclassified Devosia TaxID=196773 RepID=UPI00145DE8E5|nr:MULTISPECIES: gamma-glutamylcyclotransferase [unclassified Devosia]MBJ6987675.1 gamma-glutamylcyclotransferase [Devosia sp. MC521]QMW62355.1 gamma-glutamylcyclotransferase [Devosia sp. MC521]
MQTRWVFGYGSLIWNPGFSFVSSQLGMLRGAHRSLSIISHHHRGTPDVPGLVFGLARGGSCRGMAFEVSEAVWDEVRAYLDARELVTSVYRDVWRPVTLADGRRVSALAYVVDEAHEQFAGSLPVAEQLAIIRAGVGISGRNVDYVINTANMLSQLGIRDKRLADIVRQLQEANSAAA